MAYTPPPSESSTAPTAASDYEVRNYNLNATSGTGLTQKFDVRDHNRIVVSGVLKSGTWATATVLVKGYVHPTDSSPATITTLTAQGVSGSLDVEDYVYVDLEVGTAEGGTGVADFFVHAYFRPFLAAGSAMVPLVNGAVIETIDVDVIEDGGTVKARLQADGGGDVQFIFDSQVYKLDCTPALTVDLTAGTDTVPQLNYVYVTESSGTLSLEASTSGFPSTAHSPICTAVIQSAASLATDGALKVHAWTDHISKDLENGHLSHLNAKIRTFNATWTSGVVPSDLVVSSPDAYVSTTSGSIFQLHPHSMPALDMQTGDPAWLVNDPTTPYKRITTFDDITQDAVGGAINNRHFPIVLFAVVSEDEADCKHFFNLPTGTYANQALAEEDASNYAVFAFPTDFVGTAFLVAKYTVQGKTSGAWVQHQKEDLRGLFPSTSPGSGSTGGDVVGPASSTDDAIATFDGATGKVIQDTVAKVTGAVNPVIAAVGSGGLSMTLEGGENVSGVGGSTTVQGGEGSTDGGSVTIKGRDAAGGSGGDGGDTTISVGALDGFGSRGALAIDAGTSGAQISVTGTIADANCKIQGGSTGTPKTTILHKDNAGVITTGLGDNEIGFDDTNNLIFYNINGNYVLPRQTLSVSTTTTSVSNSASFTTVASVTVPGNLLSTNRCVEIVVPLECLNNSGVNDNYSVRVTYGSTVMYEDAESNNLTSDAQPVTAEIRAVLRGYGTTSSQRLQGLYMRQNGPGSPLPTTGEAGQSTYGRGVHLNGTASEDSTGDLTFLVEYQCTTARSNFGFDAYGYTAEVY